jgi:hypothetical protein
MLLLHIQPGTAAAGPQVAVYQASSLDVQGVHMEVWPPGALYALPSEPSEVGGFVADLIESSSWLGNDSAVSLSLPEKICPGSWPPFSWTCIVLGVFLPEAVTMAPAPPRANMPAGQERMVLTFPPKCNKNTALYLALVPGEAGRYADWQYTLQSRHKEAERTGNAAPEERPDSDQVFREKYSTSRDYDMRRCGPSLHMLLQAYIAGDLSSPALHQVERHAGPLTHAARAAIFRQMILRACSLNPTRPCSGKSRPHAGFQPPWPPCCVGPYATAGPLRCQCWVLHQQLHRRIMATASSKNGSATGVWMVRCLP